MRIPAALLEKMLYYREEKYCSGEVFYTNITLVMPWYRWNVNFTFRWNLAGKDPSTGHLIFRPDSKIEDLRIQLDSYIEMRNLLPAKAEANNLINRIRKQARGVV